MSDDPKLTSLAQQTPPDHHGFLDKTFGEIIQNNKQAQNIIMNTMHIDQQRFQEMLQSTGNNELMSMTIRDMFKNGIMQQAASSQTVQITPGQMQQLNETMQNNGGQVSQEQFQQITGIEVSGGQTAQQFSSQTQKSTLFQKVKNWFS